MVFGTGQVIVLAAVCFTVVHADPRAVKVFHRPKCQAPDSRQGLCDRRSLPSPPDGQQHYQCVAFTPDPCPERHHWQPEGAVCFTHDLAFNCTRGKWTRTDEGLLQEHRQKRFIGWVIAGIALVVLGCAIFCPRRGPPPNRPPKFTSCPKQAKQTAPEGQNQATVSWAIPKATDPDGGTPRIHIRHGRGPGSMFPEGTSYTTYEAKDSGGLIDVCFIEVTVNVVRCSLLRAPQYGQRPVCRGAREENLFGARCQFSCHKGYTLRGHKDTLTCQKNGEWSHPLPRCSPVPCGDPAPVSNGVLQCRGDHTYQDICDLQCHAGYSRATHSYTFCNANGQWTPGVKCEDTQAPTFPDGCPPNRGEFSGPLGSPVNVTWKDPETKDNEDPKNVTLTSSKRSGSFFDVGVHTVKVTATDSAGNTGSCSFTVQVQERVCPTLTRPDDGHVTCDRGQREGSKCRVRCEKGHEMQGAAIVTCEGNSTWSAALPSCPKTRCPDKVPEVKGGNVLCPGSAVYGTSCPLFCLPGYASRPPIFIHCTANGTWSAVGSCQDTAKPELECPDNLEVFASPLGQNTSVTWRPATVTDNSGENLTATSDVMPGSHFGVGLMYVTYTATDSSGNRGSCRFSVSVKTQSCGRPDLEDPARNLSVLLYQCPQGHVHGAQCTLNCSYGYPLQGATTITCKRDDSLNPPLMSWRFNGTQPLCIQNQCPPLDPPQNGALSCVTANYGRDCLMSCHANYDIRYAFDGHFVCTNSERRWRPAAVPQCLEAFRPDQAKLSSELLYFTNSCEVSLQQIKENFIQALSNSTYRDACVNVPSCTVDNVQVTCGPFSRRRRSVGSQGSEAGQDRWRRQASVRQKILIKFDIVMDFVLNGTEEETFSRYKSLESGMNTVLREEAERGLYNIDSLTPDLRYFRYPTLDFDGCPNGTRYHQKFTSTKPSCVGCSKGHFLQGTRCAQCPKGQYTALDNATSCTDCPPGFSTLTSAADSKDHCKELCTPGYFSSDGFVPCQPCPAGSYQSRDQGVSCDLCPAGTWTEFAAAKSRNDCVAADAKLTTNASLTASLTSEQQSMTVVTWLKLSANCSLSVDVGLSLTSSSSPLTLAVFTEGADDALGASRSLQLPVNQWVRLMMVSRTERGGLTFTVYNGSQVLLDTSHPPLSTPFNATFTITTLRGTGLVSGLHGQPGGWTKKVEAVIVSCTDHMDNNSLTWTPRPASVTTPSRCDAVDECQSRPCGPQGVCQNGPAGFLCHCQQGWSGDTCQVAPDACYQHQCQDGARCVPAGQNYTCQCPEEKSGHLCQLEKVHGEWGEWGPWSQCSLICAGRQRRQRLCNNPAPANEGRHCSGPSSQSQSCGDLQCSVDGAWSTWSSWSQCSATCGGGERNRSRRCDNPEPQHGGAKCSGPSLDLDTCATAVCPVHGGWGNWSEWSPCSVTCGDGIQSRERSCDNPVPASEGQPCQGLANQTRPCNSVVCPVCSELPVVDGTTFNCSHRADPYRKTCRVQCTRGYSTASPQVYTCGQETGYLWDFQRQGTALDAKYAIQYCTVPSLPIQANMTTIVPLRGASCAYMDNISHQISLNLRDLPCRTQDKCSTVVKGSCGPPPPSSSANGARRRREVEEVVVMTVNFTANFQQILVFNASDNSTLEEFIRDFRLVDESAALIALNDTERLFTATVDNVTFTPDVNGSSYTAALGCAPGAVLSADGGCVDCPAGFYEEGGRCMLCPLGQYQDRTGSTSCQHCPPHTTWDSPGASQLSQCLGAGTQATTTPTTTGDTSTEERTEGGKTNTGIIIAATIGTFIGVVAIAVTVTVFVVCWLKKQKKKDPSFTPAQPDTRVFDNVLYQHPNTAQGVDLP